MKKKLLAATFILGIGVLFMSAIPGLNEQKLKDLEAKKELATKLVDQATKDGSKLSFKELKKIATEVKGSELSLKDKIALKLFNKKLSKVDASAANSAGGKSQLIALLLVIFVGTLGIHRFYLGYTWQGIVQLLTLGVCGIWTLIDMIRIITGDLTPKDGSYDKKL